MDGPAWAYEALPKAALYMALLVVIGTAMTRWLLLRFARSSISAESLSDIERTLAKFGFAASSLALAALVGRLFAHTAVSFGLPDALHWDNLHIIALESRWGHAWRLQVSAAAAVMLSAFGIRLHRRAGWFVFTAAALILCAMIPLLGHGATSNTGLVLHFFHLLGMSAWLGTLGVIAALSFRRVASSITKTLIANFSVIALTSAALVTMTGAIAAYTYVGSISNLFTTSYGRTLLVKLAGFAGILACGWSNWRRARSGQDPRPQMVAAELAFAVAVVLVTSVLTEMDHP